MSRPVTVTVPSMGVFDERSVAVVTLSVLLVDLAMFVILLAKPLRVGADSRASGRVAGTQYTCGEEGVFRDSVKRG